MTKTNAPIALATGSIMPKADPESHLLVDALANRGVLAEIIPWSTDVDWARFSLVVVRTPWDYFKRLEEFLAWLTRVAAVTCLTNPHKLIEWNCHKGYLRQLAEAGLPTVPTIWLQRHCPDPAACLADDYRFIQWGNIVIKPAVSIGAIDILRTRSTAPDSIEHIVRLLSRDDVLIQPYLPGISSEGEVSLIFFGGEYSHAVRKIPRTGDFRVQDLYGGSVHPHVGSREEIDVAKAALAVAPAQSSYARIDLVPHNGSKVIMEVELIEPELFLSSSPRSATRFAATLCQLIE